MTIQLLVVFGCRGIVALKVIGVRITDYQLVVAEYSRRDTVRGDIVAAVANGNDSRFYVTTLQVCRRLYRDFHSMSLRL